MKPAGPIERQVPPGAGGSRVDAYLASQPEVASRTLAKTLVQEGRVSVNGAPCKPGTRLEGGDRVAFHVPPPTAPPAPRSPAARQLRVLHEDPYMAVIDKPAGIAVHPPDARRQQPETCITHLAVERWGKLPVVAGADRPGIVHRLDKDTSGVMALARTEEAFHFLQSQFKARTVRKEYRALCYGDPRFDSDWVEGQIAVDPGRGDRMAVVKEGGKEASTYWEVLERFGDLCYLRCSPRSGRTHQIRVHMASAGHPLVGDRLYTAYRRVHALPDGAPDPGRHALHAWALTLRHPRTHEEVQFDAPLPDDFNKLLRWLQRRGVVGGT